MNTNGPLGSLLADLWGDLQQPDVIWQVAVLACCLGVAWLVGHVVRRREVGEGAMAWQLSQRGLKRLAFPLSALALVLLARAVMAQWHHVNLLSLAIPLLASLAVIRAVFFVLRHSFRGPMAGQFRAQFRLAGLERGCLAHHRLVAGPDRSAGRNRLHGRQAATQSVAHLAGPVHGTRHLAGRALAGQCRSRRA